MYIHVRRVTQQTCLPCRTADMSAVSHSRHVCCVAQQTCLLCHTADMSAVSRLLICGSCDISAFRAEGRDDLSADAQAPADMHDLSWRMHQDTSRCG